MKSGGSIVVPSADVGAVPDLRWIDKNQIEIDHRYQREISVHGVRHVNSILRDFNWRYFQVLTVTPGRHPKYWAIDGQHRWLAAMRHPKIGKLPCVVVDKLDLEQSAKVFEALNSRRMAVSSLQRFHVNVAANDPVSMRVDYICSEAGVAILRTMPQRGALPPLSLICISTLTKFLRRHSDQFLIAVVGALAEAWPHRANAFRAANVAAAIRCAAGTGEKFDRARMVRMLRRWSDHEEFLRAYTERAENGGVLENILAERMRLRYMEIGQ